MKFGIELGFQLPRPWNKDSESNLYRSRLEISELADRLGFDYVWVEEHHFMEEYCHLGAPEVFLAAVSQRTKQIRLGFGVMLLPPAISHPVRSAEKVATVDILSEGRVDFGIGSSSDRVNTIAWNIPWEERQDMTEAALKEVVRMFVEEPYMGCDGKYFSFPPRNVIPKPYQKPHPPLWQACSHRENILKAARNGMGALSFGFADSETTRQWSEAYHETFRREAVPIGYSINPNLSVLSRLICRPTDSEVAKIEEKVNFWWYGFVHYFGYGNHQPGVTSLWDNYKRGDYQYKWDTGTIGTPNKIRRTLKEYEEAGLDNIVFSIEAGTISHEEICASLELFANEVMPEFKEREMKKNAAKTAELEQLSELVLARKQTADISTDIPIVNMKESRPWYQYMGFPLDDEGFPIIKHEI